MGENPVICQIACSMFQNQEKTPSTKLLLRVEAGVKRLLTSFAVIAIFLSQLFVQALPIYAIDSAYYDQKKAQLEASISRIQRDIDSVTASLSENAVQAQTLQAQQEQLQEEMNKTEQLLSDTRDILYSLDVDIEQKQLLQNSLKKKLTSILREIQVTQKTGPIELLVTSQNIGQMLSRLTQFTNIANQTDEIRLQLAEVTKQLESQKAQQSEAEKMLKETRSLLQSKKDSLDVLIRLTQNDEQKYQQLLAALNEQTAQKNREIETNEQQQKGGEAIGQAPADGNCLVNTETKPISVPQGYFVRPMEGRISQGFGCSDGHIHDGIDVAGGIGVSVYAAAEGQVVRKRTGCINGGDAWCNGGLGNYVVLQHDLPSNDRVFTVYAHLTSVENIQETQRISQQTLLGYNGCTGNTYPRPCGPHLHFSIISGPDLGTINCNRMYGATASKCYDPSQAPFDIF